MRISDWSSDVCSSDLKHFVLPPRGGDGYRFVIDLRSISVDEFDKSIQTVIAHGWVAPAAAPMPPPPRPERSEPGKRVVVIDPGHGGVDPGPIGVRGSCEKDITLSAARAVTRTAEATGRLRLYLSPAPAAHLPFSQPVPSGAKP